MFNKLVNQAANNKNKVTCLNFLSARVYIANMTTNLVRFATTTTKCMHKLPQYTHMSESERERNRELYNYRDHLSRVWYNNIDESARSRASEHDQ